MENCSLIEETSYVEIIPIVKKYEWGKKESSALTKVFYRNQRQEEINGLNHLSINLENGNKSNSVGIESKDISSRKKDQVLVADDQKKGIDDEPYAELWYGSHISSPSQVSINNKILENVTLDHIISSNFGQHINNNEELMLSSSSSSPQTQTQKPSTTHQSKIPFLLKILSISKPLSLQVHPDKVLARKLHSEFPSIYSDENHKPEIAIALTEFETFCGFKSTLEIFSILEHFPEVFDIFNIKFEFITQTIQQCKKDDHLNNHSSHLKDSYYNIKKDLFINMLNSKPEITNNALNRLINRLEKNPTSISNCFDYYDSKKTRDNIQFVESLILRLHHHFPLDIGIICPILLNYYKLNPGDAIFIGAGTIHSYISGECLECMANSDNVIRCGLTPKLKDVPTLIQAVNFQCNNSKIISNHQSFLSSNYDILNSIHTQNSPIIVNQEKTNLIDYFVESVQEYHVQILNLEFNCNCNNYIYKTSISSPYSLLLCLYGNCNISFNQLSNLKTVQGKAFLVKSNTEISFFLHPPSNNNNEPMTSSSFNTKFALITPPC